MDVCTTYIVNMLHKTHVGSSVIWRVAALITLLAWTTMIPIKVPDSESALDYGETIPRELLYGLIVLCLYKGKLAYK